MSGRRVINPYAEQNACVVGALFIEEFARNVPLPGISSIKSKGYIPYDMIRRRGPYKDEDNGWTEVIDKRNRRRERLTRSGGGGGGWIGGTAPVPVTPVFGRNY